MVELNQIYNKNCLDFMEGDLEPESIDLIVTSPPYADMRDYVKIPADEYVDWFMPVAKGLHKILKPNGVFVLNIRNNVVKGKRHTYVYKLVDRIVEEAGFDLIDDIIWDKGKMLPNTKGKRPMDCWEFAFVFGKGTDVTWNPDPNRTPYDERSLARYEAPIKRRWGSSRNEKGDKIIKPHPLGCFPKNILKMGSESAYQGHPAPFPVTFAEWFVKGYSNAGDVVYDPFGGGGTTAVAAQKHGRKWVLTEIHQDYVDLAKKRIQDIPEALF